MKLINCRKKYDKKVVLDSVNVDFSNKIYHLKGENGVGKSVFCRCLLGLEKFTEGEIVGKGENVLYIPDTPLGEDWLSMEENVDLLLSFYNIRLSQAEKADIMKKLNITDLKQNYHKVSVGTSMKIGLFMLFVSGYWDLIVMDEATSHIDAGMRKVIWQEMEKRAREGAIVIIVDHNIEQYPGDGMWNELLLEGTYE